MKKDQQQTITIIGAGLGGCFLALLFAKRGYKVNIYERSSEKEIMDTYTTARSYNLTLYDYGLNALKEVDVWEEIKPTLVRLVGSVTQIAINPDRLIKDKPYHAVQRATLLKILIKKAKTYPSVSFHFGKELIGINRYEKTIVIQDIETKKLEIIICDVIFGADGVNSPVRAALQIGQQSIHIQEYADWQYKQIHFTNAMCEKLGLQPNLMYAWTRKETLILAHPNFDNSFSALLILPKTKGENFTSLSNQEAIESFFSHSYPSFKSVMPTVTKAMLENPVSNFVTIYTQPWYYKNFIAVIGDAAHGFNPFYGQGVSAAFADGMTIAELVDKHGSDWQTVFAKYQEIRKKHTDALATLSKESIAQYTRYKKADYAAVYNKLDVILYQLFPKLFNPPPYVHIATNPLYAGDYLEKHTRQRGKARWIGIPIAVGLVTGLIAIQEITSNVLRKKSEN